MSDCWQKGIGYGNYLGRVRQLVEFGSVPWSREDMIGKLEEFALLNEQRPFEKNVLGMRAPHTFLAWFVLQHLQPSAIVESGVARGQGSWFFEKACPYARLYCIDPRVDWIGYRPRGATYFTQDFSTLDWDHLSKGATVLFFDDHQNAFERVKLARQWGFMHLMFEDNYPVGVGDCYSLKQAFECAEDAAYLKQNLEVYHELPPVLKAERTRWDTDWDDYPTPEPLLNSVEKEYQQVFWDEAEHYTWMCYARIGGLR